MGLNVITWLAVAFSFVLVWIGACYSLASIGDWSHLAGRFKATEPPHGIAHHRVPAHVGRIDYGATLTVHVSEAGLFLKPLIILRPGHPCLFIPWSGFTGREELRFLRRPAARLTIGGTVPASIVLPQRLVDEQRG